MLIATKKNKMNKFITSVALVTLIITYVKAAGNPLSEEFINEINSRQSLWKAGQNFDESTPIAELRKLMGVIRKPTAGFQRPPPKVEIEDIPETFDAREQWPDCQSINEIRDQSACGSCWAVAAASAMSDRYCIFDEEKRQPRLSAINIMSCCYYCGDGCDGGAPLLAFYYWGDNGIVTGGEFNSSLGCQPYPFAPCDHVAASGNYPACQDDDYNIPECNGTCTTSESYEETMTYGVQGAYIINGDTFMQKEILAHGPAVTVFDVYEDFLNYKSGIYKYTMGENIGAHAVKIIGWGVENGTKYWLLANSWNEDWGENGLFRMIRGEDNCGVETELTAAMPKY